MCSVLEGPTMPNNYDACHTNTTCNSASTLINMLHQQRDICMQIGSLGNQPSVSVNKNGSQEFVNLDAKRQNLIEQLSQANNRLNLYKERWHQITCHLASSEKKKITALFSQIHELVLQIEYK